MDFLIPTSVPAMVIATILLSAVLLFIAIDGKSVRQSRTLLRQLLVVAKQHSLRPVSVVVELNQSANSIFPLLDHLFGHQYDQLEVVTIIKHTAGKNARKELESYRRKHKVTGLRLVKHRKGLSMQQIIRRYTKGELLLRVHKDDRLSRDFFVHISLDRLLSATGITAPIHYVKPGKSVASGLKAHFSIWSHAVAQFRVTRPRIYPLENGIVYDRSLFSTEEPITTRQPALRSRSAAIISTAISPPMSEYLQATARLIASGPAKWPLLFIAPLIVAGIILLGTQYPNDLPIVMTVIVAIYVAISARTQLGLTGYSISDQVTLLLLSPFGLIFAALLYLISLARMLGGVFNNQTLRRKAFVTKPLRLRRQ